MVLPSGNSIEHVEKVKNLADDLGYAGAAENLGVTVDTVKRRCREWRQLNEGKGEQYDQQIIRKVRERFTDAELKRILDGGMVAPDKRTKIHKFGGDELVIGCMTDTHHGSVYSDEYMFMSALEEFSNQGVDFIVHCGDVTEGLSNRAGHWYECTHIGYSAQLDYCRELYSNWTETPIYMVDGNHDRWYLKSNGAIIVKELCKGQENLEFLGHDEGDIRVKGVKIKLWHGEDGNSYAYSYRVQKIIESLTGGEKPNVLICGHTHKAIYLFDRHVHCVSAGAMQRQSKWMRGKRHASHTGFYVLKLGIESGVSWFESRFFPFYV